MIDRTDRWSSLSSTIRTFRRGGTTYCTRCRLDSTKPDGVSFFTVSLGWAARSQPPEVADSLDMKLSRRFFLRKAALMGSTFVPMVNRGRFRLFAQSEAEYSTRAVDLVQ